MRKMKKILKNSRLLRRVFPMQMSPYCQQYFGATLIFGALFLGSNVGLADSPASSPDDPNFAPTNIVVKAAVGPNEYSQLEDALYKMGSQKVGRDAEEVCYTLKNVCSNETTVWEIDYTPGIQVLVQKHGEIITEVLFEHNGVVWDKFHVSEAGIKLQYDGKYFYQMGNCNEQDFSVYSTFTFGDKGIALLANTRASPCGTSKQEAWEEKLGLAIGGSALQNTTVSYTRLENLK
jgi:hypothetical protein